MTTLLAAERMVDVGVVEGAEGGNHISARSGIAGEISMRTTATAAPASLSDQELVSKIDFHMKRIRVRCD
jgi:hypothetical protein